MTLTCVSCGKRVETESYWVRFKCPACSDSEVIRCEKCRRLSVKYKCPKCGFEGP